MIKKARITHQLREDLKKYPLYNESMMGNIMSQIVNFSNKHYQSLTPGSFCIGRDILNHVKSGKSIFLEFSLSIRECRELVVLQLFFTDLKDKLNDELWKYQNGIIVGYTNLDTHEITGS